MKKITLIILVFISIISLTACEQKFGSDVTPEPTNVTITGKWSFKSLGTITNKKSYEMTPADFSKIPGATPSSGDSLSTALTYEFKTDSTYIAGNDSGKWKSSSDGKTIVLTSKVSRGFDGKFQVLTFSVLNLTANELVFGLKKFTANSNGEFNSIGFSDLFDYILGILAFQYKGTEQEIKEVTSFQGTINLKR